MGKFNRNNLMDDTREVVPVQQSQEMAVEDIEHLMVTEGVLGTVLKVGASIFLLGAVFVGTIAFLGYRKIKKAKDCIAEVEKLQEELSKNMVNKDFVISALDGKEVSEIELSVLMGSYGHDLDEVRLAPVMAERILEGVKEANAHLVNQDDSKIALALSEFKIVIAPKLLAIVKSYVNAFNVSPSDKESLQKDVDNLEKALSGMRGYSESIVPVTEAINNIGLSLNEQLHLSDSKMSNRIVGGNVVKSKLKSSFNTRWADKLTAFLKDISVRFEEVNAKKLSKKMEDLRDATEKLKPAVVEEAFKGDPTRKEFINLNKKILTLVSVMLKSSFKQVEGVTGVAESLAKKILPDAEAKITSVAKKYGFESLSESKGVGTESLIDPNPVRELYVKGDTAMDTNVKTLSVLLNLGTLAIREAGIQAELGGDHANKFKDADVVRLLAARIQNRKKI